MGSLAFEDTTGRLDEHASSESIGQILFGSEPGGGKACRGATKGGGAESGGLGDGVCGGLGDGVGKNNVAEKASAKSQEGSHDIASGGAADLGGVGLAAVELAVQTSGPREEAEPFSPRTLRTALAAASIWPSNSFMSNTIAQSMPTIYFSRRVGGSAGAPSQPSVAQQRLQCVVLNGCKTEDIGRHLLSVTGHVAVVCW